MVTSRATIRAQVNDRDGGDLRVVVISVSFADVGYRMSVLSISGWSGFSVVAVIAVMSKSCRHAGQLGGVVVGFVSGQAEEGLLERGRLAGPVRAEETGYPVGPDGEAGVVDGHGLAVALGEVPRLDHHSSFPRSE